MNPREFLDVDPQGLRLPRTRPTGPDLIKFYRQLARYGSSTSGMPPILVSRGTDGELVIMDGVTRASRAAREAPGVPVTVEVIDDLPIPVGHYPSVGDHLP